MHRLNCDYRQVELKNKLLVMLRYPENPDPDRSGSGFRSRTDLRANPEPDSGLKKKKKILFLFCKIIFFCADL